MEGNKKYFQGAAAAIGLLIIIFDSKVAMDSAKSGIDLCLKTVIPSLLPFFILSILLTRSLGTVSKPMLLIANILNLSEEAAPVLVPAFLGGYPVGAKCVHDLYQNDQINREEAEHLLSFCSNAGPSFLFGIVSGMFPQKKAIWFLWEIHIASAILTAASLPSVRTYKSLSKQTEKNDYADIASLSVKAMAIVCCWVILFKIILSFLDQWFLWLLPDWLRAMLMGILELTNGCCSLNLISDVKLRFILCSCMLSFGGICVLLQTLSVISGLSVYPYIKGKLIQTVYSFLLSSIIMTEKWYFYAVLVPAFFIFLKKIQKKYSIRKTIPV